MGKVIRYLHYPSGLNGTFFPLFSGKRFELTVEVGGEGRAFSFEVLLDSLLVSSSSDAEFYFADAPNWDC